MRHVLVTGAANVGRAGVATIVYKWGQEFDSNEIIYDYLMQSGLPEKEYQEAIKKKGGKVYTIQNGSKNVYAVIKWIEKIIRENQYEAIHINTDTAYVAAAYIYAALKAGIKNIYVHSHCTQVDDANYLKRQVKTFFHYMFRPYVCRNTKVYLSCSKYAGVWMFGKKSMKKEKVKVIYNGVEVERYLFDPEVRRQYRSLLNIEGKFVVGCIGRFSYQKNHKFLLKVFSEISRKKEESILLLIGDGELRNKIEIQIKDLELMEKVILLGIRKDVPLLLNAMDVMVLPSRFEGLPVTLIEAQMSALPCIVSNNITHEAKFTKDVKYIKGYDINKWVKAVLSVEGKKRERNEEEKYMSNFNIQHATKELTQILLS